MIFLTFLIISFVFGQLVSFSCCNGIRFSVLDVAVMVVILASFLRRSISSKSVNWYLKTLGPFILVAGVSLLIAATKLSAEQLFSSSLYLVRFVLYSLLLVTIPSQAKKLGLLGLWIGGISIALFGLLQYFLYPNLRNLSYLGWDPHQYRVFSTLLDPNFTGVILALTLFLGFSLRDLFTKKIWIWYVSMATVGVAFLLTYSRGSYVAFAGGLLLFSVLQRKFKMLLMIGLLFLASLWLLPRPGGEGVNLLRSMSVASRLQNSEEALSLFKTNPIGGVGFDTLRYTRLAQPESIQEVTSHSAAGFHNGWLFILATTGIAGLASYLLIWNRILFVSTKPEQNRTKTNWILFVSCLVVAVHALFDNSLFYPQVMVWMWVLVGSLLFQGDPETSSG